MKTGGTGTDILRSTLLFRRQKAWLGGVGGSDDVIIEILVNK